MGYNPGAWPLGGYIGVYGVGGELYVNLGLGLESFRGGGWLLHENLGLGFESLGFRI